MDHSQYQIKAIFILYMGITEVITLHPSGNMNAYTTFHGNLYNLYCLDVSVCNKWVDWQTHRHLSRQVLLKISQSSVDGEILGSSSEVLKDIAVLLISVENFPVQVLYQYAKTWNEMGQSRSLDLNQRKHYSEAHILFALTSWCRHQWHAVPVPGDVGFREAVTNFTRCNLDESHW